MKTNRVIGLMSLFVLSFAFADERVAAGLSIDEFQTFLARSTVLIRPSIPGVEFQSLRYELLRGESIEGGCRYTGAISGEQFSNTESVIAMELAHDPRTCERLFVIGVATDQTLPEWAKAAEEQPSAKSGAAAAEEARSVSGCQGYRTRWTDGNQSLMRQIRNLVGFKGIEVAQANASVGYRGSAESIHDHCTISAYLAGVVAQGSSSASAGGLPTVSWKLTNKTYRCNYGDSITACFENCTYWGGSLPYDYRVTTGVTALAENYSYIPGIFDCRQGARIFFRDVGVRSQKASGTLEQRWEIAKEVEVTGPIAGCTENLYEDQAVYECTPPQ